MDERIEAFFKWFLEDKLANMESDEYQQMVDTLVKLKKAADVRLGEEVSIQMRPFKGCVKFSLPYHLQLPYRVSHNHLHLFIC